MNEKNLTFGNASMVVQIDMTEAVRVRQATRDPGLVQEGRREGEEAAGSQILEEGEPQNRPDATCGHELDC
jgi:hypothetical protein